MMTTAYRPRNAGHDYYGRGTYLITLVVSGRQGLLSRLTAADINALKGGAAMSGGQAMMGGAAMSGGQAMKGDQAMKSDRPRSGDLGAARVTGGGMLTLTPLGAAVEQAWLRIPEAQAAHGNRVTVHACVCMPDHFHGVIEVLEPMEWSLGDIIQAFKATCTSQWQRQQGMGASTDRPISVDLGAAGVPGWLHAKAAQHGSEGSLIRALSKRQRQEYYALVGRSQQPLFDDNYDDTVCLDERHRQAMIAYVHDNPRRALLRRMLPDVMRRCLHVRIGDRSYGAFGNLFLLRWARKIQVMCHRKHPVTGQPYEGTTDYASDRQQWEAAIQEGCTAIVTPGISGGERLMKEECLERGFPLIHLQKEPIGAFWKPERKRFDACANGALLILAPWDLDAMGRVAGVPSDSDYSRFHNLNALAAEICAFNGEAKILRK